MDQEPILKIIRILKKKSYLNPKLCYLLNLKHKDNQRLFLGNSETGSDFKKPEARNNKTGVLVKDSNKKERKNNEGDDYAKKTTNTLNARTEKNEARNVVSFFFLKFTFLLFLLLLLLFTNEPSLLVDTGE